MGRLNKPAKEGYKYRSPSQTNAKDLTPNLREDVIASQKADAERIRRGLDTSETRPQNRRQVQEAGGRATTRTGGRAGLAGLAAELGYGIGREIDERTGVGKKIVEKSGLGDVVDKVVNMRDKVKLSKREKADDSDDSDASDKFQPRRSEGDFGMKKGGAVSASKRADGIAQRGKTKGRMC